MDSRVVIDKTLLTKELKLVQYPGVVKNEDRMLQTLGGIGRVSQIFCEQVRRMELVFHPDNRYCKPTYGEATKIAGILLKIKIRKPRNGQPAKEPLTHHVEVLGHCRSAIKFNSLCDYQYLPIVRNPETNHFEYLYDKLMPKGLPPPDWLQDTEQPLLSVPALFARCDTVQTAIFRHDRNKLTDDVIGVLRRYPGEHRVRADFSLTELIPTQPNPAVYKVMLAKLVNDHQYQAVKRLFDETPIWNRVSLLYEANISNDKLKCIIPALCYHYRTGPWRTMYVRYGYDPRIHFEARYYQTFDYRIRYGTRLGMHIQAKRVFNSPRVCPRNARKDPDESVLQDTNYPYLEDGRLPRGRQSFYRYCDVRLPTVQKMLDKIPTPLSGATCNEKTGWLPSNFSAEVRSIVHNAIKQTIQTFRQESGMEVEAGEYMDDEDFEEDDENSAEEDEDIDVDAEAEAFDDLDEGNIEKMDTP